MWSSFGLPGFRVRHSPQGLENGGGVCWKFYCDSRDVQKSSWILHSCLDLLIFRVFDGIFHGRNFCTAWWKHFSPRNVCITKCFLDVEAAQGTLIKSYAKQRGRYMRPHPWSILSRKGWWSSFLFVYRANRGWFQVFLGLLNWPCKGISPQLRSYMVIFHTVVVKVKKAVHA